MIFSKLQKESWVARRQMKNHNKKQQLMDDTKMKFIYADQKVKSTQFWPD